MKNKFEIYDIVYIREDKNDNSLFDWDKEAIYMVVGICKNYKYQKKEITDDLMYEIHAVVPDCGSGIVQKWPYYFKGSSLRLYKGNDEDVLFFTNDAKIIYKKRLEDRKYKINHNIKYKFKKKDILVLKNDHSRIFYVYKYIENSNLFNTDINKLIDQGYIYMVEELIEHDGIIDGGSTSYAKEEDYELYTGNDKRIFEKVEEDFKYIFD